MIDAGIRAALEAAEAERAVMLREDLEAATARRAVGNCPW